MAILVLVSILQFTTANAGVLSTISKVHTIGGVYFGGNVATHDIWGSAFGAARVMQMDAVSFYVAGRWAGDLENASIGGPGYEGFVVVRLKRPDIHWYAILGGGRLFNVRVVEGVGELKSGATYKLGLAYELSDDATVIGVAEAIDTGWDYVSGVDKHRLNLYLGISVDDLLGKILAGVK